MSRVQKILAVLIATSISLASVATASDYVPISKGVKSIDISLNGDDFVIKRNQSQQNTISPLYNTTHRGIIQPIKLAEGIETVGELEFIDYMQKAQTDENIAIVDSRTPGWYERLRIPGAINVPFTHFNDKDTAYETIELEFDGELQDGKFDFSEAKTLVIYCNGYWCPQTPMMIKDAKYALLKLGYPPQKIKYYRGGMQAWVSLGLTVVGTGK